MRQSGFNPKARWDRHIPEASDAASPEQLEQKIEVLSWFKAGKILPCLFVWNNKEYKITNINYNWQERQGRELISFFSVSTGADIYQISFNNATCGWRLDKIIG